MNLEVPAGDDLLGRLRLGLVVGTSRDLNEAGSIKAMGSSQDDSLGNDGSSTEVEAINAKGNNEGVLVGGSLGASNNATNGLAKGSLAGVEEVGVQDDPVLQASGDSLKGENNY